MQKVQKFDACVSHLFDQKTKMIKLPHVFPCLQVIILQYVSIFFTLNVTRNEKECLNVNKKQRKKTSEQRPTSKKNLQAKQNFYFSKTMLCFW